ncbi:MAG: TRAP transporter small permease subunit [Gammaproteobacteria bacterium]
MSALHAVRMLFQRLLETICVLLMVGLAVVVVLAVGFRYMGSSLSWYDEVAAIMLAWLTYYGAALAALRRAHLGFPNLVSSLPPLLRVPLLLISEALVFTFFGLLAWFGWQVIVILQGDTLTSLPWVSISFTQSVIPIGAVLFMIAEAITLPEQLREAWRGETDYDPELRDQLAPELREQLDSSSNPPVQQEAHR